MMMDQGDFVPAAAQEREYQSIEQYLDAGPEVLISPRCVIEAAMINYDPLILLRETASTRTHGCSTFVYKASIHRSTSNPFDDRHLPREVAVKFSSKPLSTRTLGDEVRSKHPKKRDSCFKAECRFVVQHLLNRPEGTFEFVARYYGLSVSENSPLAPKVGPVGLVMEHLPLTLTEFLKSRSSNLHVNLSYIDKVKMALKIANGLKSLHSANPPIVHCSLCAENILLTPGPDWEPRIANFDMALLANGITECPHFLVPAESQPRRLKTRCDMYGYAKLLVHIETNIEPSSTRTPVDLMKEDEVLYEVAFTKVLSCGNVTRYLSADEASSILLNGYEELTKELGHVIAASSSVPGGNQFRSSTVSLFSEHRSQSVPPGQSMVPRHGISSGSSTNPLNVVEHNPSPANPPESQPIPKIAIIQRDRPESTPIPEAPRERAKPGYGATFEEEPIVQDPKPVPDGVNGENPEKPLEGRQHDQSKNEPKRNLEDARLDYLRKVLF